MALTRALASAYLGVSRWKLSTQPLPDKVIVIGAPHTSNWDGVFMTVAMWKQGRSFSFLVKDSVVKAPLLGWFVKKIGGIPVKRGAAHGLVEQVATRIRESQSFTLCLTPKGTRSPRDFWKSGFYRIAMQADVPIQLGFVDRATHTFGWGPSYRLTGDVRADMDVIRAFYADKVGARPEYTSVPRLRTEDEDA